MKTDNKLDWVNRWITLAANIGVLLGIIFLIVELRQNTTATRLQASSNFQDSFSNIEFFITQNAEFAALLDKGRKAEAIDRSVDQMRLDVFYGNVLRTWQNAHTQYQSGALDEDIWRGSQARLTEVLKADRGLFDYWQTNQTHFGLTFNAMIASITDDAVVAH